jgi:RNA polymerase sigma-70 factor (ECF subfamily)
MWDTINDADLVRRARAGSDAAFGQLVVRRQAAIRGFLRRMLGRSGDWAEADDLAQDVFLEAWRALSTLRSDTEFQPWLMGIAWRRSQDRTRSVLRGAVRDRSWLDMLDKPAGLGAEDRMALADAMGELAPDMRACVALCLADGWSHGEAATALGLPLGTVKSHVARGRARLLKALGGSDDA